MVHNHKKTGRLFMKKVKKAVCFIVIAAMMTAIAIGFTACRGNDVELAFAWWGGDFRAEQTNQVLDLFLEQNNDVDYIERFVAGFGDHWTNLATMAAANNLPDVMQHDVAWVLPYVEAGHLVDLTPFLNDNRIDVRNIPATVVDGGRVPGHVGVFALPIGMNVAAMLYNETLIRELGLSVPRNITLQQFIDLSREIYERSGVRTNWAHNDPFNQMNVHLRAQGASLFRDGRLGGTVDQYRQFFDVIVQGLEEGWHIRPEHMAGREGGEQNPMWYPPGADNANLRTWNSPVWSNMITGYMADSPEGMDIGMTTYPSTDPIRGNFGRASMFLSMTTHSDNQDEAAELINFWMNSVAAHEIMLGERGVIVNPVVGAAVYDQLTLPAQRQLEFVGWINDGNSSPYSPFRPGGAGELLERLRYIIEHLMEGNITAQQAAEDFADAGAQILN
jgi:multiple sugar transport system substrate-binding protein